MTAVLKRNGARILQGLEPEEQNAVRKAARHAGMSLDEWVASVVQEKRSAPPAARPPARRQKPAASASDPLDAAVEKLRAIAALAKKPAGAAAEELGALLTQANAKSVRRAEDQAVKTALALDTVASWIEQAEGRMQEHARRADEREERTATVLKEALALMTRRLDEIERKTAEGAKPSTAGALQALERIEAQLAQLSQDRARASGVQIESVLRGFEERISQIADRLAAAPRPIGRRGFGARQEIGSAVSEIRARQAQLDRESPETEAGNEARDGEVARSGGEALRSLKSDIARIADRLHGLQTQDPARGDVAALRVEIERLQAMVQSLATREELVSLERSFQSLATEVAHARDPGELAQIAAPIEALREEVRHLTDLVATGVHGRLSRDLDALARRIDAVAERGVDPSVIEGLAAQLAGVRRLLQERAEPQRVHDLADELARLHERVAELSRRQVDTEEFRQRFDTLSRKIDGLGQLGPDATGLSRQLEHLAERLDRAEAHPPDDIAERIDALSRKLDQLGEKPRITVAAPEGIDTLVQRLDQLDAHFARAGSHELKSIEDMLRALIDRIDQADRPGAGADALDALEKQISLLARKIERGASDPALASLERSMSGLLAQVEAMRSDTYDVAERAARTAVADALASLAKPPAPDLNLLKHDLAELKTSQSAADRRMQSTLESVHAALEKVVARLSTLTPGSPPEAPLAPRAAPAAPSAPPSDARPPRFERPDLQSPELSLKEADRPLPPRLEDVLLEPGAGRPALASDARAADAPLSDIRANLIAAARRAAANAQAAVEAGAAEGKTRDKRGPAAPGAPTEEGKTSLARRFRETLQKHRRPVLLGLAAVVLALGALQVIGLGKSTPPAPNDAPRTEVAPAAPPVLPQGRELVAPHLGAPKGAESRSPEPAMPPPATGGAQRPERPGAEPPVEGKTSALSPAIGEAAPGGAEATRRDARAPAFAAAPPLAITPISPAVTGAVEAPPPAAERIVDVAAVGELPSAPGLSGLRQAAISGDPIAVYELASRLAEGRGLPRDLKLAAKLFEKAAAGGFAPAQYRIGNHYEKGLGVARDLVLARAWYQRAAEKGNARAMHNLAVLSAEGSEGRPDYATAADWFRRAAERGVKDSQFNFAVLLARGLGQPQNLTESYKWFAIAAAQGDGDAARKRDEVGARLSAGELAAARAAAERFRVTVPDRAANEVVLPAHGWAEPADEKPAAKASRAAQPAKRV